MSEKDAKEYKDKFCSGCAKIKINPTIYYGEEFCGDCVEKWRHGKA